MSVNKVTLLGNTGKARILKSSTTAVALQQSLWRQRNEVLPQRTGDKSRSVPNGIT